MTFRIDLHVHSKFSGDTDSEPEESIIRAIEADLHGIAFTEHYSYGASEHAEKLREKYQHRILIFRGVEFSAAEGHCLVFGVDTDKLPLRYASFEEVVRIVNQSGGVVIPSHLYRGANSLGGIIRGVEGICAIEGYNGYNLHAYNEKAIQMARLLNLPYTGGSDAHAPEEVGSCFTEFVDKPSGDSLVRLLKEGNYRGVDMRRIARQWIP